VYEGALTGNASLARIAPARRQAAQHWGFWAMPWAASWRSLDIQIVASSNHEIRAGLSASIDEIQWVQTSYLIAEVTPFPLSGLPLRMLSTRVYFVISAVGFTLASIACASFWSLGSMVVFRVLQGLLARRHDSHAFATMFIMFPDAKSRAIHRCWTGMLTMTASSLGPSIGGYVTDTLSWHWLFPAQFSAPASSAPGRCGPWSTSTGRSRRCSSASTCGACCSWPCSSAAWNTPSTTARATTGSARTASRLRGEAIVGGGLFFWRSFTAAYPIVDLRSFRDRISA